MPLHRPPFVKNSEFLMQIFSRPKDNIASVPGGSPTTLLPSNLPPAAIVRRNSDRATALRTSNPTVPVTSSPPEPPVEDPGSMPTMSNPVSINAARQLIAQPHITMHLLNNSRLKKALEQEIAQGNRKVVDWVKNHADLEGDIRELSLNPHDVKKWMDGELDVIGDNRKKKAALKGKIPVAPSDNTPNIAAAYETRYRYEIPVTDENRAEVKQTLEAVVKKIGRPLAYETGDQGNFHVSDFPRKLRYKLEDMNITAIPAKEYREGRSLLEKDAAKYFDQAVLPPRPATPAFGGNETPAQIIEKMLQSSKGMVVGETHAHIASKKFLIDNMAELARQGVTTLYMENLCSDTDQHSLDQYAASSPGSAMPPNLKTGLAEQDSNMLMSAIGSIEVQNEKHYQELQENYNFSQVVAAAQAANIKVVALDCEASYDRDSVFLDPFTQKDEFARTRLQLMNFLAGKRIANRQDTDGKWVALVGSAHATTCQEIPGVAELTGALSIVIDDDKKPEEPALRTSMKPDDSVDAINPDVVLTIQTYAGSGNAGASSSTVAAT